LGLELAEKRAYWFEDRHIRRCPATDIEAGDTDGLVLSAPKEGRCESGASELAAPLLLSIGNGKKRKTG